MFIDFSQNAQLINSNYEREFEQKIINFIHEYKSEKKTVSVQTSGSTGTPKIFEIEKQKMLNSAKMTCDYLGLKEGNTALICLPTDYISGKMMVVRSIERKLKMMIENPSIKPLENLNEEIDFCAMTPLQVENSLDKIHFIKNLIIGGASVSENLRKKIQDARIKNQESRIKNQETKANRIFETYGMSETLSHIALKEIHPNSQEYFSVMKGIEISLDKRGCLKIFAPQLNPKILSTNDLVEIKEFNSTQNNQQEFKFLGRIDHVINSGGAKISPEELECFVKKEIPNETVFIGIPDEILGQKLIVVIEGFPDEKIKDQISNIKYSKKFHHPKEILFVEKIPRTLNGKVNRKELLDLLLEKR